jgi:hypothetical protein
MHERVSPPFVPFREFRDSNALRSQFALTLETLSLRKPAPDQPHLEAVAFVSRFDQLTPGEQIEGAVQFSGELAGQSFPADHSPFSLRRQEVQQGQPGDVHLVLLDTGEGALYQPMPYLVPTTSGHTSG